MLSAWIADSRRNAVSARLMIARDPINATIVAPQPLRLFAAGLCCGMGQKTAATWAISSLLPSLNCSDTGALTRPTSMKARSRCLSRSNVVLHAARNGDRTFYRYPLWRGIALDFLYPLHELGPAAKLLYHLMTHDCLFPRQVMLGTAVVHSLLIHFGAVGLHDSAPRTAFPQALFRS